MDAARRHGGRDRPFPGEDVADDLKRRDAEGMSFSDREDGPQRTGGPSIAGLNRMLRDQSRGSEEMTRRRFGTQAGLTHSTATGSVHITLEDMPGVKARTRTAGPFRETRVSHRGQMDAA
ncbi:hypothetical protein [Methylobacterium sp. JK268]